jgi:EPS-associated MarR family transcriptional regulator
MTEQPQKEEVLFIIKELEANPEATQRDLSNSLNISLGKTNYLIRELAMKGLVKAKSFTGNPGKLKKIRYILTEKAIEEKLKLIRHFLQIKKVEYNRLKQEMERSLNNMDKNGKG